jgi:phosphoribosylformimino-5-aminoimidazole carboxamide ribotide isomerase
MSGQAVHARRGDRSRYRPLRSELCNSSEPRQVVDALLRLHDFSVLYIADLDAILDQGENQRQIDAIHRAHPRLTLWLDRGVRDACDLSRWARENNFGHLVIGSESLSDASWLRHPALLDAERYALLSLDFHRDTFLGPAELQTTPGLWPRRVIVMALARVGSALGPDLERLRRLITLSPATAWYAGGGVRDAEDLSVLNTLGVGGALIATALHSGAIDKSVLAAYTSSDAFP